MNVYFLFLFFGLNN